MPMEDPNNKWIIVPTPEEIEAGCKEIKRRWSRSQEQSRRNWHVLQNEKGDFHPHRGGQDRPYEIPEILG